MLRKILIALVVLAVIGGGVFWVLTTPDTLAAEALPDRAGDPEKGREVFLIGGCASCHSAPGAEGEDRLKLAGGRRFASPFGTFLAPNISTDPEVGIGGWSTLDLANAMLRGVSPSGQHLYPAFPYVSYAHATLDDVVDLKAYLDTLPAVSEPSKPHELGFPFNIRRGLGLWKLLYFKKDRGPIVDLGTPTELEARGQYLVEGLGHCGECHTPRDQFGGLDYAKWLSGAPSPDGEGKVANITHTEAGIGDWSATDIAEYLRSGFTPEFDTSGGEMVDVIKNTSQLPDGDRDAIAAYLLRVGAN